MKGELVTSLHVPSPPTHSYVRMRRARRVLVAGLLPLVLVIKYGIGLHPQWFRFADAAAHWPNTGSDSLLAVGDRALLANVLPAWIAGALHLTSEHAFIAFSIAITVAALSLPLLLRLQEGFGNFTRLYLIVCLGGSLAPVLLMWVGGYDALLVCFLAVGALVRNRYVSAVAWALAAFTHSSVAIPAAVLWLAFVALHEHGLRWRRLSITSGATLAGLLIGYASIHLLTDVGGGSTDRFALFRQIPFSGILQCYANSFPALIFSGLGITWLLIVLPSFRKLAATRTFFVMALAVILIVPLTAVDETRITALIMVPLTLAWIDCSSHALPTLAVARMWRWSIAPALVIPVCVVWMGTTHWPYWM